MTPKSLRTTILTRMMYIAVFSTGMLFFLWMSVAYLSFLNDAEKTRETYESSRKAMLQREVLALSDFIHSKIRKTDQILRTNAQKRVNEAHALASHLFHTYQGILKKEDIAAMIREALRPLRFDDGLGYYFIFDMDGKEILFADRPEMEGRNMLSIQGAKGEYVVRDMLALVREKGEGFYTYTWTRPGKAEKDFQKTAFVRAFEPLGWIIGTGSYLEDVRLRLQDEVLAHIVPLTFEEEGYFFGSIQGGAPLFTNGQITRGGKNLLDLTDPDGVRIIEAYQDVAMREGSGFVRYAWRKPHSTNPSPKISFVTAINEWHWIVGAGVYLDTIEEEIRRKKETLFRELLHKAGFSFTFLALLSLLAFFWIRNLVNAIQKSFDTFMGFFKRAASEQTPMETENIGFSELRLLALNMNKVLKETASIRNVLKDTEDRYRLIFEHSPLGLAYFDQRGVIMACNDRFVGIAGASREVLQGLNMAKLPDSHAALAIGIALKGSISSYEGLYTAVTSNKKTWLRAILAPVLKDGKVQGGIGMFEDISERKKTEEALQKSEEKYHLIFDNSPLGLLYFDEQGKILDCNENFVQLIGSSHRVLVGLNMLLLPDQEVVTAVKTALSGEKGLYEGLYTSVTGHKTTPIRGFFAPAIKNGSLLGGLGIFEDISERWYAEKENKKLEAQLQQAQKMESVGRLAGGVAHDFNNMLSIVLGYTEIAKARAEKGQSVTEELEEVHRAAMRSANLTRQLLAFARKQTISPEVLDLNASLEGMLHMMRRLIGENIELVWKPGSPLWTVRMDPSQLDQILANLCVNARDAISGVGMLTVETENIRLEESYCDGHPGFIPGEFVKLSVSDNGCGMDADTLAHIFEPFFTTKSLGEGTGLGLATIYGIVKQNNGFINVYTEPGRGSTFSVYFPKFGENEEKPAEQTARIQSLKGGHESILLVEDEPAILEIAQTLLKELGYKVLAFSQPQEALDAVSGHNGDIHLLITDVIMPGMNGRDLAAQLKERFPDLRTLFMSGYTANVIARHGVLEEDMAFIQKPFQLKAFAARVREALGG